jgi:hypothetical protein
LTNLYGVIGISRQVEFQQRKRDEEMEVVMSKLVFACELIIVFILNSSNSLNHGHFGKSTQISRG